MERKSYYLIILLVAFVICMGVFWFQFNNDVSTFIIINETEVHEGDSFSGMLMDAYSYGVANQTVSFHKPGSKLGTIVVAQRMKMVSSLLKMQNICLMQVMKIIMEILPLQAMENTSVVLMRAM